MGVITTNIEITSTVPAQKLFNAFCSDLDMPNNGFIIIDEGDKEALTFRHHPNAGDDLPPGAVESKVCHFKSLPTERGCMAKIKTTYTPIRDEVLTEKNIKQGDQESGHRNGVQGI